METNTRNRKIYRWFYNNIHYFQYDFLMKLGLLLWGGEKKFRREMIEPVDFLANERILDLCCGTGGSTLPIREKVNEDDKIVGADLSYSVIRVANKKNKFNNVNFIVTDATNICFENGYFNKVFIPHALHEMPRGIRQDVLKEAKRVLKENGKVIILELDNPKSIIRRLLLGLILGYWVPYPINFENPTRRDMLRCGLTNEVRAACFRNVQKVSKFYGTFQVVLGEK